LLSSISSLCRGALFKIASGNKTINAQAALKFCHTAGAVEAPQVMKGV